MIMCNIDFDIVIPVGPNDISTIELQIEYTKKNVIGYRNIYLISFDSSIVIEGVITIDENIFPFTKENVIEILDNVHTNINGRSGWYLQQLLKIYSGNIIPGILKRYLIIDSDTYFLKPTEFITKDGKHIFTTSDENTIEYFEFMTLLHPSLKKFHEKSGISHHSFFHTDRINELIELVENYHSTNKPFWNDKPFWIIFLEKTVELLKVKQTTCVCSEYEVYFNFMYKFHPDEIEIRKLKWSNVSLLNKNKNDDYQSVHWYLRYEPFIIPKKIIRGFNKKRKIPYKIHQTFTTNFITKNMYYAVFSYIYFNSKYDFFFYDDNDISNILELFDCTDFSFSNTELKKAYKKMNTGTGKADIFRYMILYTEGGCFFDVNSVCRINLDALILDDDELVSGIGCRGDLHQWAMIYSKKHPFVKKTLENSVFNIINETFIKGYENSIEGLSGAPCLDYSIKEVLNLPLEYKFKPGRYLFNGFIFNILDGDFLGNNLIFKYDNYLEDLKLMNVEYLTDNPIFSTDS